MPAPWLFPLLLPLGLLVPGLLLGRALRTPAGPAGALLGSAVVLTNLTLILAGLGLPLDTAHYAAGLALICGVLAGIAHFRRTASPRVAPVPARGFRWTPWRWLWLPAVIGVTAIAWRAIAEPLSGFDTGFRWDFLAQEMLRVGHLNFYPPVIADDFLHYSWCDGIAPLISTLYLWAYCSLGHVAAWATAPIVIIQAGLLFWLVGQLAARRGGEAAGAAAVALLATNAWLLWAVAMGQETGFTALGLLGMFYFLERARAEPAADWPAWAGIAAGAGALAREYGLAFIVLGWLAMAWHRTPRRGWCAFSIAAGASTLPWYLRNWLRTGNPLWSQNIGGLFPTNPVNADYAREVGNLYSIASHPTILLVALTLLASAVVPIAMGVAGALSPQRDTRPWLLGIVAVVALWLWSVGQTSGGPAYSLRVLAPAFALGAVFGGLWVARWLTSSRARWLALLLAALAMEAAGRSFYLPIFPSFAWWRRPTGMWRYPAQLRAEGRNHANWQAIADAADGRKILVSDPSSHTALVARGAKPAPFFSPEVRFLFDTDLDFAACVARLRALGFRFVLITRGNNFIEDLTARRPFFRSLYSHQPAGVTPDYFVYDLYLATPTPSPATAAPPHVL